MVQVTTFSAEAMAARSSQWSALTTLPDTSNVSEESLTEIPVSTEQLTLTSDSVSSDVPGMLLSTEPSLSSSSFYPVQPVGFLPWDNPDNVISLETYTIISLVSNCVLYPLLLIVGVPGNLLSCAVFWRQGLRERMNLCLFCLSLVDLSYLVVLMVQATSTFLGFVDEALGAEFYAKSLVYCLGIGWGFKAASGCFSMVIALERCLCVARPLHVETAMRTRTMGWLLAVIVVGMQLAQVIQPLAYDVNKVWDTDTGQVHWNIVTTRLYADNKVVLDFVLVILLPFVIPVVSFVVVSLATAITVVKLRGASRWRKESCAAQTTLPESDSRQGQQQRALTVVLVLLSCVYIACTAPLVAVTLVRLLVPDFSPDGRYSNICIASHQLGTVASAVNSAVNFFVYYVRSSRFREILFTLRRPRGKG